MSILGAVDDDDLGVGLILEFAKYDTLSTHLRSKRNVAPWVLRLQWLSDMSKGMKALHQHMPQIIHSDMKVSMTDHECPGDTHTCTHACTHACTRTCTHTRVHTPTHTYTPSPPRHQF